MQLKRLQKNKGFTLVETLVAIFILVLSITGPMYFAASAIQSSRYAKDQITAFYLTQEALEMVKNIRDRNTLLCGRDNWMSCNGINLLEDCENGCNIYYPGSIEPAVYECDTVNECRMELVQYSGVRMYSQETFSSPNPSIFSRMITIEEIPGREGEEVSVSVQMDWVSGKIERQFVVRQNILNWIPLEEPL